MSATQKIMPLDKTVVMEFKVQVADIHMRSKYMNESIAVRVPRTGKFIAGDAVVDVDSPVILSAIQSVVAIHSYTPFLIDIVNDSGAISGIPCTGLFVLYGALGSVVIRPAAAGTPIRLTYLHA